MEPDDDDEVAIMGKLEGCEERELWWVLRFPLRCSEVPKLVEKRAESWKATRDAVRSFVLQEDLVEEEWDGHPCFQAVAKRKAEKRAEVAEELLEKLRTAPDLRECLASIWLDDLLYDERWAISYPRQAFAIAVYHALPVSLRSVEATCIAGQDTQISFGGQHCLTIQWERKSVHWCGKTVTPFNQATKDQTPEARVWNGANRKGAPHEFDWKDGLCDLIHGYGYASWATAKEWVRAALASPRLTLLLDQLISAEDRAHGRVAVRALELACAPFVQLQRQLERLENPVTLTVPDDEEELGDWAGKSFEVQLVYDVPTGFAIVAAGENLKMVPWQFMDRAAEVEEDLWCRIQGDIVDAETKEPLDEKWGKVRIKAQLPHENTLVEFVDCPEVDWRSRYEVVSERDKRLTRDEPAEEDIFPVVVKKAARKRRKCKWR
jgi:hypothetical protein